MLAELAELSHDQEHCQVIFAVLEYRIRSPEHKWRCVYKALQVLEYLLQRGSAQCVNAAQDLVVPLAALQNFAYLGDDQKDYGQNVRLRADAVKSLILDTEGLAQKRAQLAARAANMNFAGYSREELAAGAPAAAGPLTGVDSPPGQPVTPTPTPAAPGTPAEGPLSPSAYRPPSLFVTASATRMGQQQQSSALRNAGETKGVTFEQNKRQLEQLRQLTLLEGNRTCADCAAAVAAARPTWASINLGVFICMRCAGIHRGLGVHISKVRSTTLDTWLQEQVATMARLGNRRANAYFEAGLDPALRPSRENTLELERFIRLKYADKVWAAKGPWPPEDDAVASVTLTQARAAAAQSGSSCKQQPNGATAALHPLSPPLPASTLGPNSEPALWSSSWPHAASSGGGFGDAPPAWPSPTTSITPPSSSQPNQQQRQVQLHGTPPAASGARSGASGAPVMRLLPPPPGTGPPVPGFVAGRFGAAAAAGPQAARDGGGVLSGSSTDLLQLDSDSEDEGEEGAGGSGGGASAREGAAGGPTSGTAALWDLLDPTLDVMTWLDRVEGTQQRQQQQPPQQPQTLMQPTVQHHQPLLQQQPSHQRTPSAPVFGTIPAVAALQAAAAPFHSPSAAHLHIETPALVPAIPSSLGGAPGAVSRAATAGATPTGGSARLGVADSVIMTAEFPVYDLLTPLPTGGGPAAPPPVAAATAGVAARQYTTPPASLLSQAYPPMHLHHQAPNSAPSLQQPSTAGGGAQAALPSNGAGMMASATTNAVSTPPGHVAGVQRSSAGMLSAGVARTGSAMGMGMRGAAAAAAQAAPAAGPGPALDLDNLLAMQLDSLGSSLAGAPNGNGAVAVAGRPSWQPVAAVGSAYGGVSTSRR